MKQRTLKIGDRLIYCYDDGSVEFLSRARMYISNPLVRTKGHDDSDGYKVISLSVNGKMKNLKVHRLIALAFHLNHEGFSEVDHINRDKSDNRPCNLRWIDHRTNASNRDFVDRSLAKYGVRRCDDRKAYNKSYYRANCDDRKAYNKSYNKYHQESTLNMTKPNGKRTRIRTLSPELIEILAPLSERERYIKYQEVKNAQTNPNQVTD